MALNVHPVQPATNPVRISLRNVVQGSIQPLTFVIERVVLFFGDRHLLTGAANVDKVSLLIFIVLHDKTSDFRVVPEPEVS